MKRIPVVTLTLVLSVLACVTPPWTTGTPTTPSPTSKPTEEVLSEPVTTPTTQWTAVVRQVQVNVRAEPDGKVIGIVLSGETVEIMKCDGSWCQIVKPAGWVWRGCLSDNPMKLGCTTK